MNRPLTQLQYEHLAENERQDAAAREALRTLETAVQFRFASDGFTRQLTATPLRPSGLTSEQERFVAANATRIADFFARNPDAYAAHAGEPLPSIGERERLPSIGGKPLVEMTDAELIQHANRNRRSA